IVISMIGLAGDKISGLLDAVNASKPAEEFIAELDDFVVNLKSENKVKNYIRINVDLMYTDEELRESVDINNNKIKDIIIHTLQSKTASEMLDQENIPAIKEEMKNRVNDVLGKEWIKEVYFTDMVVQ